LVTQAHPGAALKSIRRRKSLTLAQVSELADIPISTLGRIERGESSPNYEQLLKLSEGLEVDITHFFARFPPDAIASARERRSINRTGEGQVLEVPHQVIRYLSTDLRSKSFTPIVAEIQSRSLEEFGELLRHPGEEFVYVLEGTLELHTEHYTPAILEAHESIYFDSSMGHAYIARGNAPCRVLAISTAPHAHSEEQEEVMPGAVSGREKPRIRAAPTGGRTRKKA
jgi:transcriptional regulator with XRE-family HTH domain